MNGGFIVDTPGFSLLNLNGVDEKNLYGYYSDYMEYLPDCRYSTCTHTTEPDCAVLRAVAAGKLDRERYDRYLHIYEEIKKRPKY